MWIQSEGLIDQAVVLVSCSDGFDQDAIICILVEGKRVNQVLEVYCVFECLLVCSLWYLDAEQLHFVSGCTADLRNRKDQLD